MNRMTVVLAIVFQIGTCMSGFTFADEKESDDKGSATQRIADQIKGKCVILRKGPDGPYKVVKEHLGKVTRVTTYNPNNVIVYSHQSEYRIDSSGPTNVFYYKNRVVLAGPNAGDKDATERAYIFRVEGGRFIEVSGMLKDDIGPPSLKVWERPKANDGVPATNT